MKEKIATGDPIEWNEPKSTNRGETKKISNICHNESPQNLFDKS